MSSEWMDELTGNEYAFGGESYSGFYCPYTNGSQCALSMNKSQPRDLCEAIECDQLKFHPKKSTRRRLN